MLVGGAAINRRFGRRILFTEDGKPHEPGVFYCKDAFEGLETMDQLIVPEKREELLAQVLQEGDLEMGRASQMPEHRKTAATRSDIQPEPIAHPAEVGPARGQGHAAGDGASSISASMNFTAFPGAPRTRMGRNGRSSRRNSMPGWHR